MERLVELKNIIENNDDLNDVSNTELILWGAILEDDEVPVKNFIVETNEEDGSLISIEKARGHLLLTDRKIIFIMDDNNDSGALMFNYGDIDSLFTGVNENNAADGIMMIVTEGLHYTFSGLLRFGLTRWEEYINVKMSEFSDKD